MDQTKETVIISTKRSSKIKHTNPDCKRITDIADTREVTADRYEDYELCKTCDPDADVDKGTEKKHLCPNCGERVKRLYGHLPCNE
jgi:predicted RNA-binding Zn-ribbon protein involved in translation (DUF1610 family)